MVKLYNERYMKAFNLNPINRMQLLEINYDRNTFVRTLLVEVEILNKRTVFLAYKGTSNP